MNWLMYIDVQIGVHTHCLDIMQKPRPRLIKIACLKPRETLARKTKNSCMMLNESLNFQTKVNMISNSLVQTMHV